MPKKVGLEKYFYKVIFYTFEKCNWSFSREDTFCKDVLQCIIYDRDYFFNKYENLLLLIIATVEMQILSLNFFLYTICGLWRPIEWSSKCSKLLYSMFTFSTLYLLTYLMLTHLLYIIFVIDNMDDFASCSPFFFSTISVLFKATTAVIYRDQIINLIETLQEEPCKACNEDETDIQMKFDRSIRLVYQ